MSVKTVRKQWPLDIKTEAVRLLERGQSIATVAIGLNIPRSTVGNWLRQSHAESAQGQIGKTVVVTAAQLEITRLRAEISRL